MSRPFQRTTRASTKDWETYVWDNKSFRFPQRVSQSGLPQDKQTFYQATIHAIDSSNASSSTKSAVLKTRFAYKGHIVEAENRLRNLLHRTAGHASTIDLSHESFTFGDLIATETMEASPSSSTQMLPSYPKLTDSELGTLPSRCPPTLAKPTKASRKKPWQQSSSMRTSTWQSGSPP